MSKLYKYIIVIYSLIIGCKTPPKERVCHNVDLYEMIVLKDEGKSLESRGVEKVFYETCLSDTLITIGSNNTYKIIEETYRSVDVENHTSETRYRAISNNIEEVKILVINNLEGIQLRIFYPEGGLLIFTTFY